MKLDEIKPVVCEITPRRYTSEQKHSITPRHCMFIFIQEGRGEIWQNDQRAGSLEPNSIAVIPAHSEYLIRPNCASVRALTVSFDYLPDLPEEEPPPEFEDAPCFNALLTVKDIPEIGRYLSNMQRVFLRKEPHWQLRLRCSLGAILTRVAQRSECASHEIIGRVIDLISEHYMEPLNNASIAAMLGYHPNYVNSVFVREMGIPLHQYLMRYRVEQATHLLLTTSLSISDISEQVGFRHFSHFSNCFHRLIGVAPAAYRLER